jgi:hypothetical protein
VGPTAGVDMVAQRKNPCPCRESNLGRPTRNLVTILSQLSRLFSSVTTGLRKEAKSEAKE